MHSAIDMSRFLCYDDTDAKALQRWQSKAGECMDRVLTGALIWSEDKYRPRNIFIRGGIVTDISQALPSPDDITIACGSRHVFPGFTDVHVHLREPGFSYKETITSGTLAAARGGYTALCAMPNVRPMPDSLPHLEEQLALIRQDARVRVIPYGTVTRDEAGIELSDMAALAPYVAGFSDDGRGVQDGGVMRKAMLEARRHNRIIAAHCEDEGLLHGGLINDCAYALEHMLPGISKESEWGQLERDLELVRQAGCRYHACHLSTMESVALIRRAKAEGLDVTCETAPHYLLLDDGQLQDDGRFRMNPPLRGAQDRRALIAGLLDGTVDMIATDHAPHSAREKAGGLLNSLNGVAGLECAFPLLYHHLVRTGAVALRRLIALMHDKPNERFGIDTALEIGKPANLCVWDLDREVTIDPDTFLSLGRSTPFAGWQAHGACTLTIAGGRIAWQEAP